MKQPLREALRSGRTLIHCGGTGTELMKRGGVTPGGISNLDYPDIVRAIERDYLAAGADVLLTNTFSMNAYYAQSHVPDHDFRTINREGARITCEEATDDTYVCACIGPVGELLIPFGPADPDVVYAVFREQAELLQTQPVDAFSIQTFYSLDELELAVRAVRDCSELPVIASLVLDPRGYTLMGDTLDTAYARLKPYGIDVLGHNCGEIDGFELAEVFERFGARGEIPLAALVNAGKPQLVDGQMHYDMSPELFTEGCLRLVEAGVQIIGGCCGTTPAHIAALSRAVRKA